MAKTKAVTTRKRKRKAPLSSSKSRRRPKPKGFLNDLMNPTIAMNSAKTTASGAAGGAAAIVAHKLIPASTGKLMKLIIAGVGGFGAAAFGLPHVGSGFTGGMIALNFQNGLMGEDMEEEEFADETSLEEMPLYLDAAGEQFVIEEDPNSGESYTRYLTEEEKELVQF
jgi:hypothetical protein